MSAFSDRIEAYRKENNIEEIIKVRVNNTLAEADKNILKEDVEKIKNLSEYSFNPEFGYLVCAILDGKARASSKSNLIISYEYESVVNQNLLILSKINELYNKLTHSSKNIAIISDAEWEKQKNKYPGTAFFCQEKSQHAAQKNRNQHGNTHLRNHSQ